MNITDAIDFGNLCSEAEVRSVRSLWGQPIVVELDDVEFDTEDEDGVLDLQVLVVLSGYVPGLRDSPDEPGYAAHYEDVLGVWAELPGVVGDRCFAAVKEGSALYDDMVEFAQRRALEEK